MASFDPIIRMNDNVFRGPEKMKSKAGRKPLGDVTNSSKPLGKNKAAPGKTFTEFKGPEKVQPPKVRKPLGDLTNSQRPRAQEKLSNKKCVGVYDWVKEERNIHNHDECVKAQRQSMNLSLDYFLETVGLKKDSSIPTSQTKSMSMFTDSDYEVETRMELAEFEILDICAPASPPTPKAPASPCRDFDWTNLNFSPVKLKESPVRN
ncbi:uncharacterized protein LOC141656640 [Silene latifolia]|uniref:uncharacterized protein LOC141656640 n=1 Tax=Silene latifolia TaxID=37657 RepID=UPI003D77E6ED